MRTYDATKHLPGWARHVLHNLGDNRSAWMRRARRQEFGWRLHRLTSMNSVRRRRHLTLFMLPQCPVYWPPEYMAYLRSTSPGHPL